MADGELGELVVRGPAVSPGYHNAVVLGYTMFRNVYPFPSGSAWWGPGLFLGVAVTAIGIAARPAVARRAGELLTRDEGLAPSQIQDTEPATEDAPPVLRTDLTQSP
ncbi:hypothetical protein ACH47Z_37785 [Streptomyces sp. NPDC020192]|uniref:hypothetical protein n=1 Tax=Streptomyces sp. NPDC020192 TaxID=3365066 RepID=UPI0037A700BE